MHQEEIDSGEMTFNEAWNANVQWLEDMVADVTNISLSGCGWSARFRTDRLPVKQGNSDE